MNIVVLGGGTAGWLTALTVKRYHPDLNITLIESSEIGILGAGEGTTPPLISHLNFLDISFTDLVKNCSATVKIGINFKNWNGDNKNYFHGFSFISGLSPKKYVITKQIAEFDNLTRIDLTKKLCDNLKVPFVFKNTSSDFDPLSSYDSFGQWACHFDAVKLAKYLREVAEKRGITRIEGKMNAALKEKNKINGLKLEDGRIINCDFVFDCSGFSRLLIGKVYNTEWISYKEHLPLNRAIPFFIPHDNNVAPVTESIAMKYGWIWKIPVKDRFGCGYVFDSNFITDDEAIGEAETLFQKKVHSPKTFKFEAGTYKETYVENCMAVGLAQSFVEPLEATSIMITAMNVSFFLDSGGIYNESEIFRKKFNEFCLKQNEEIRNFLYLHYLTKKQDSWFWKKFQERHPMIDEVKNNLELLNCSETSFITNKTTSQVFSVNSWLQVCCGLELISSEKYSKVYDRVDKKMTEFNTNRLVTRHDEILKSSISHKEFINHLGNSSFNSLTFY